MEAVIGGVINIIASIGFFPLFLFGLLVSLFLFWYESYKHKDKNSIFDMWLLTVLVSMIWGRVSFIIVNWHLFSDLVWSIAPYERYGDEVFLFRLLPWRFFDLSDGGFLFTSIFAGYLVFAFIYNIYFKKWRWREMFFPVIISAQAFLCITLIVYGSLMNFTDVVYGGLVVALIIAVFLAVITVLRKVFKKKKDYNVDLLDGVVNFLTIVFVLFSFTIITRLFLLHEISVLDQINLVLMNVAGIVMTLYFVFIEKKPKNRDESVIMEKGKSVTININKPFKVKDEKD